MIDLATLKQWQEIQDVIERSDELKIRLEKKNIQICVLKNEKEQPIASFDNSSSLSHISIFLAGWEAYKFMIDKKHWI